MKNNTNKNTRKNDVKILVWIIIGFLLVVWLCTPPGNKFMQICFWGNNTKFMIAKMQNKSEATAYKYYRNNAVYLARMKMKDQSLAEIDKAIQSLPAYMPEDTLESLYKDRAEIRLFYRDYRGSLSDFMKVSNLDLNDKFKIAMLYKTIGNNREAIKYCNEILQNNDKAYAGWICLADVYDTLGRPDASAKVLDLLIDRVPNRAKYYADRSMYKQKAGDEQGAKTDMLKAKEINSNVDINSSLVKDTLEPKVLTLPIN